MKENKKTKNKEKCETQHNSESVTSIVLSRLFESARNTSRQDW